MAKPIPKRAAELSGAGEDLVRLRVEYAIGGRLALLSHLEVARFLERTVRRAGLPFAVTRGFSPHMKMAFGSALPVGVGGLHEVFDVFLERAVDPELALDALQRASVPDVRMRSCRAISRKLPAASVAYPFGVYEVELSGPVPALAVPQTVTVTRKGKERELRVADFLAAGPRARGRALRFALEAKPEGSLRADAFAGALLADAPVTVERFMRIGQAAERAGAAHLCIPEAEEDLWTNVS